MNSLKDIIAKKKQKSKQQLGENKWLKRSEREGLELKQAATEVEPAYKKRVTDLDGQAVTVSAPEGKEDVSITRSHSEQQAQHLNLSVPEVKRRLRKLGHPATLFGEDDTARKKRLLRAESEIAVRDEEVGGGDRANTLLELQKEDRKRDKGDHSTPVKVRQGEAVAPEENAEETDSEAPPEDPTMRAFREAAERLARKRELDSMTRGEKIAHHVKQYMQDWKSDLDARAPAACLTMEGKRATDAYRMTEKAFDTLYARLKRDDGSIHEEVVTGMLMMLNAMNERNYQFANEVYHKLAIGNATWPIGVTSVGIHERSAREKISHYANKTSQAHIMNDETTRKFLQGMKRLMTAVQRLHPTDPSRSVDFNAVEHDGLGARAGKEKQLLLKAEAEGDTWKSHGMAAAPHFLAKDGSVSVPPTWGNILRSQEPSKQ